MGRVLCFQGQAGVVPGRVTVWLAAGASEKDSDEDREKATARRLLGAGKSIEKQNQRSCSSPPTNKAMCTAQQICGVLVENGTTESYQN